MGVLPTTERGRSTRRRIVAAAREVVAEKGAAGASLDEVGALAPASRSQLYHYFDDKDDLIRAVAEATNDIVLDGQRDFFAGLNTWDGLVRWTDFLVAIQEQRHGQGGCPIATLLGQLAEQHDDIRVVLSSGFDRWEAHIRPGPPRPPSLAQRARRRPGPHRYLPPDGLIETAITVGYHRRQKSRRNKVRADQCLLVVRRVRVRAASSTA